MKYHPLTEKINRNSKGRAFIDDLPELDQIIRQWLQEKAEEIPTGMCFKSRILEVLEITEEKTLLQKFQEKYKRWYPTVENEYELNCLAQVAEDHFKERDDGH